MSKAVSLPSPHWGGLHAWDQTLVYNPVLVTPVRHMWVDYLEFARADGFPLTSAVEFVQWLKMMEGVDIREGGRGRVRRMLVGVTTGNWKDQQWTL